MTALRRRASCASLRERIVADGRASLARGVGAAACKFWMRAFGADACTLPRGRLEKVVVHFALGNSGSVLVNYARGSSLSGSANSGQEHSASIPFNALLDPTDGSLPFSTEPLFLFSNSFKIPLIQALPAYNKQIIPQLLLSTLSRWNFPSKSQVHRDRTGRSLRPQTRVALSYSCNSFSFTGTFGISVRYVTDQSYSKKQFCEDKMRNAVPVMDRSRERQKKADSDALIDFIIRQNVYAKLDNNFSKQLNWKGRAIAQHCVQN